MLPDQTKFITKFLVNRVCSSKFTNSTFKEMLKLLARLEDATN